jgi:hypothetical protein
MIAISVHRLAVQSHSEHGSSDLGEERALLAGIVHERLGAPSDVS